MAQNRRQQAASVRFGPAVAAFLICLLVGGSGVGYVWQKGQIKELGELQKQREQRLVALRENNHKLRHQLGTLMSTPFLERRVRELNLGLVPPQPAQVLRLPEPVSWQPRDQVAPQLAVAVTGH